MQITQMHYLNIKLRWATKKLEEVSSRYAYFQKVLPTGIRAEFNNDRTEYLVRIYFDYNEVIEWSLVLSDFVFNLRCVLDYFLYGLFEKDVGRLPVAGAERLQFPIFKKSPQMGWDSKAPEGLDKLSKASKDYIWQSQPFITHPSRPELSPLYILHELCNMTKHRYLSIAVLGVLDLAHVAPDWPIELGEVNKLPLENGSWLVRYRFPVPAQPSPIDLHLRARLSLDETIVRDREILKVLNECLESVKKLVKPYLP